MNFDDVQKWVIFEGITGSHAYGTSIPESDVDTRQVFVYPKESRLSLIPIKDEYEKEGEDTKAFELKKFMELAVKATPNILELLWLPEDCIHKMGAEFQLLVANRRMFITKQTIKTHACYAISQIKKSRGQNKLINNPLPAEKPDRLDFCWFVESGANRFDTVPIKQTNIDLSKCRVTAIPHLTNCFHVFENGDGVFKGDMLVCDHVNLEERNQPLGMFTFQEDGYTNALGKWTEYWNWVAVRNPARWEIQEKGLDYDCKNMLHLIRLLLSSRNIIDNGEPIIRFTGETLTYLRKIRTGVFSYDDLMEVANPLMAYIESKMATCSLPDSCDIEKADKLYKEILN